MLPVIKYKHSGDTFRVYLTYSFMILMLFLGVIFELSHMPMNDPDFPIYMLFIFGFTFTTYLLPFLRMSIFFDGGVSISTGYLNFPQYRFKVEEIQGIATFPFIPHEQSNRWIGWNVLTFRNTRRVVLFITKKWRILVECNDDEIADSIIKHLHQYKVPVLNDAEIEESSTTPYVPLKSISIPQRLIGGDPAKPVKILNIRRIHPALAPSYFVLALIFVVFHPFAYLFSPAPFDYMGYAFDIIYALVSIAGFFMFILTELLMVYPDRLVLKVKYLPFPKYIVNNKFIRDITIVNNYIVFNPFIFRSRHPFKGINRLRPVNTIKALIIHTDKADYVLSVTHEDDVLRQLAEIFNVDIVDESTTPPAASPEAPQ
jgi:hypothetical protein